MQKDCLCILQTMYAGTLHPYIITFCTFHMVVIMHYNFALAYLAFNWFHSLHLTLECNVNYMDFHCNIILDNV